MNRIEMELGGRPLVLETGRLAKQANGAVKVQYGDTVVLCTVTASKEPKDLDFFPLTVNYEERLYSVGKIPGGFIKREGRPSEKAILASRLIDRPIRPLFPEGFRNDIQIVDLVMSVDQDCSPEMAAMIGTSAALSISDVPFNGPIGGVVVGRIDGQFIINPTVEQEEKTDIHVTVAGTKDAIMMVEAEANEVPEEVMLEAIMFGHEEIRKIVDVIERFTELAGTAKMEVKLHAVDTDVNAAVRAFAQERLVEAIRIPEKHARQDAIDAINQEAVEHFEAQYIESPERMDDVKETLYDIVKEEVRRLITHEKVRPDGRKVDEIRPIECDTSLLPRTHGSGLFTRGQTQALSICTLGALGDVQILDGISLEESKRFMHHYNFPPFSVGEARPLRAPGRREIGHGALGERALSKVIPPESDFPYTIRLVSEVLESNGSTSQASICASTLAMMDAGVPIKAPVAGIAMGLIKDGEHFSILSDIQGMEDHLGDMDFKVAGTAEGVTAIQMDIKIDGIDRSILTQALAQAREGRMFILEKMLQVIDKPRETLSPYAPKILIMQINPDKIRDVIGAGGKVVNKIIDETGVKIDIEQDGRIFIASPNEESNIRARDMIEAIVKEVVVGEVYTGTVKRIEKFGAFVEILPGKEGLVHISQMAAERIAKVEDVASIGDKIEVKVVEIDQQGRINLSRRVLLEPVQPEGAAPADGSAPPDRPRSGGRPPHGGSRPRGPRPPRPQS
ncbi:polyribonucleotide nucleotidyltransferase [Paenibacillus thiaminolyticus]|uniref:Polyribonucleotide nucleotidyltransferase n=1 Tax=Paenibacillus thiaminolyticus TaxID=49283 RepID=A0AAP9DYZ9_PANTH|nr:polyribonucleotide nucleotidyltransferase [Paenibacillus thiaminolyticus]MCY9537025.1 polyribonucleotide nucleotidyltransferase [Paenibacillus thiaminolyticus]MCY9603217.1 polyribonucleotide nucleotidyltransferase [Paenibacillus thiaminolyticus]MCY9608046.1 polyribonucleotide nucleotidyltransferase [Paenibacillus thiaminolyticus]MCY9613664.1 polyribonucleotide nucleotidyltransferase [Paenibacillus thiaminolyticus]MCY9618826.1 polyribonucleotide nucleotidyltransferase [Paenibacillus thiamino